MDSVYVIILLSLFHVLQDRRGAFLVLMMRFGLQISNADISWGAYRGLVEAVDRLRFSSAFPFDHLMSLRGPEDEDCLEAWTLLSAAAAVTHRVQLGCLVTAATFRHPAVLAKMAATVDAVSGGRLILGIGAAWHEREHVAYGVPFGTVKQRQDWLEETCAILRRFFDGAPPVSFDGRFWTLVDAPFAPGCRPPLWVGGGGEKRTLRTAALYADAINLFGTPSTVERKIRVFLEHCREVGRDPASVRRTVTLQCMLVDDPAEAARLRAEVYDEPSKHEHVPMGDARWILGVARRYADIGVDEIVLQRLQREVAVYERFDAEVIGGL